MKSLTALEVAALRAPSMDRRGTRFEYEGKILRAFRDDVGPFYRSLLESPTIERLFDAGLVRTWVSGIEADGFDLVTESERIPVVSYPTEWPTAMLREAGLLISRLALNLATRGLGLHDAHPWNVLFHGPRPVWVDLSSITEHARITPEWESEFRTHVVVPLALHAHGRHSMADSVAAEHRVVGAKRLWNHRLARALYPPSYARMRRNRQDPIRFFERLVAYLEDLPAVPTPSVWSNYIQSPDAEVGAPESYNAKQTSVDQFLVVGRPGRVLDVGANAGWFSELAVHRGHEVTAIDPDDVTASLLFMKAQARNLPILTLRMDVMWPLGSHGLGLAHDPAQERLRADKSLWLAVVHHLARDGYNFETVSRIISMFTKDAALVEFIPRDDVHLRGWWIADQPWYSEAAFIEAMAPYFPVVTVLPSTPEPRVMLSFSRQ